MEDMRYPLESLGDSIQVLGSCNGRLCIINRAGVLNVWDPSTRRTVEVFPPPVEERPASGLSICVYGFGCDVTNGSFKLLRLFQLVAGEGNTEVSVYNMIDETWTRLPDVTYYLPYRQMGVFVHGRVHFIVTQDPLPGAAKLLLAFNFHTQKFERVDLPDDIDNGLDMLVAVLDGRLCISIDAKHMGSSVWIRKVYGLEESWEPLFSMPKSKDVRTPGIVRPLTYSEDGHYVLVRRDRRNLVWYDVAKKAIIKVDIRGMPSSLEDDICVI